MGNRRLRDADRASLKDDKEQASIGPRHIHRPIVSDTSHVAT